MNTDWIKRAFLFQNCQIEDAVALIGQLSIEYRNYSKGATIYLPEKFDKKIGFVVSGECRVEKIRSDGHGIPLNTLKQGDAFGVVAVFTGCDEFPTGIYAQIDTQIAYFTLSAIEMLMARDTLFSMNVISFLANRIAFLNSKISSFSGDNVEQKIAFYLMDLYKSGQSPNVKFNKKHAAQAINVGRTSLYRALNQLEIDGVIKIDVKNIIITDLEGLERKTK